MNKLVHLVNRSLLISTERVTPVSQFARSLSNTNAVLNPKANVILRRLGIPERPKKPLTAYIRFLQEIRPTIQQSTKNIVEVTTIVTAQWKKLDESHKQKYIQEYKNEKVTYLKQKELYEKSLTGEQKLALKDERIRLRELKEERAQKAEFKYRLKKLGKPNRPLTAFILFYNEQLKKGKTTPKWLKDTWNSLDESQKNAYKQKAAVLTEEYREALKMWQKKLISKGQIGDDIIRKKVATKLKKSMKSVA